MLGSGLGGLPPGGTFIDDDGNLHEGQIEAIAAEGITHGCDASGTRYCPGSPVERAQMAAFLLRATHHHGHLPDYRGRFSDVSEGQWYTGYVEHLAEHRITQGCRRDGQAFCPEAPVTRGQMASFLVRAFRLPAVSSTGADYFLDDEGSAHEQDINALAAAGITRGCGSRAYCPQQPVLRDQMASFLARALRLTPMVPPPGFYGSVSEIDGGTRARMTSSWRPGCPVPIEDLRLVNADHWGFDGREHRGELVVHRLHAQAVLGVLELLFERRFPIERMELVDLYGGDDLASMEANNTSAFNCRSVVGKPGVWSEHAYGRAIDINPVQNPYLLGDTVLPPAGAEYLDRSRARPGMIQDGDQVVQAFEAIGWSWGGYWESSRDYQHFSATGR